MTGEHREEEIPVRYGAISSRLMRSRAMVKSWLRSTVPPGKLPSKPRGYAVAIAPQRLAAGDCGRVLVLGGSAGPPTADGIGPIAGLPFIDDGRIVAKERDDAVYIALGVELEVAPDDLGDVLERGLLLRFAMLAG